MITQMPCAFDKTKNITEEYWSISLVRRHNIHWWNLLDRFFPAQHANIIVQSIQDGEAKIIKLHATKTCKPHPKDSTEENIAKAQRDQKSWLHVQVVTNADHGVGIKDEASLDNAVKVVLGIDHTKFGQFSVAQHWDHLTWLVKKESAVALIKKIETQEIEFSKTQPPYWWFGDKSIIFRGIKCAKEMIDNVKPIKAVVALASGATAFAGGAAMGFGGIMLGLGVFMLTPICPTAVVTALPFHYMTWIFRGVLGASGMYAVLKANEVAPQIVGMQAFEDKREGHSCFTWAREMVLGTKEEVINDDKFLKAGISNCIVSVTSMHIPASQGVQKS